MNKPRTNTYRLGDEISYAMPGGMLYGTVTRVIGAGDDAAVEVEFEDAQGFAHVGCGRCDGNQGEHDIALLDVIGDPFFVDGDVALEEVKALIR